MKKQYQDVALEIVFIIDDAVRCSNNVFGDGDETGEDIFG